MAGQNIRIKNHGDETHVDIAGVKAATGEIKGAKAKQVSVDDLQFVDLPGTTDITAKNLRVDQLDVKGTTVDSLEAPEVRLENVVGGALTVYSDKVRVAKIDADAAILGSLNIGGVRLTIKQGRVEARSDDIDAGDVTLAKTKTLPDGGKLEAVKIYKPVYVLEPSGSYRVTADMSLGGGSVGSVALGAAKAKVEADNNHVALNDLTAEVMEGQLNGKAVIAFNNQSQSTLSGDFTNLDIAKLIALYRGGITPVEGQTTGRVDLTFSGTNFRDASGTLNADITANAGTADSGLIPVNGEIKLSAANGLFSVDVATLRTDSSTLTAIGRFDLKNRGFQSHACSEID